MIPPEPLWHEVRAGEVRMLVSDQHPVAVLQRAGSPDLVVSWPDLDVGLRAPGTTVFRAPTGAWVLYRPREAQDEQIAPGRNAALHIAADGAVTRFDEIEDTLPAGVTSHGLWLHASGRSLDPRNGAAWLAPDDLVVLRPDGTRSAVRVEHRIAFLFEDDEGRMLLVHTAPPGAVRRFGGTSYTYEYASVPLPPGPLPPRIVVDAADVSAVPDDELMARISPLINREIRGSVADAGVRWNLVTMPVPHQRAAVAAVEREFAGIAGRPRMGVAGVWPQTRVHVSFRHPHYPDGLLRRAIRVFDEAGRFVPALYASVHLHEDLATIALPPVDAARDGILDV